MYQRIYLMVRSVAVLFVGCFLATGCDSDTSTNGEAKSDATSMTENNDQALADITNVVETAAFSDDGLAKLSARVAQFVEDGDAAAINTVLVHNGQVVQYAQAGVRNVETGEPISSDTIFRIYSMTKPVVGVAMMMLYEEGLFQLDDPIAKYVPELANMQIVGSSPDGDETDWTSPDRQPTMREMMAHTAGFSYGFLDTDPLAKYYREKQILGSPNLDEFVNRLSQTPLLHEPGAQWNYSVAVDLQGAIIERLTGKSLGDYLQDELFDPLGMKDTGFRVPEGDFERMADGFMIDPSSGQLVRLSEEQISGFGVVYREGAPLFESGGFGLASTLPDYARFCQMLADGGSFGGKRFLKPETIELMRTNVLPVDQPLETPGLLGDSGKPGTGFGLNFGVVYDAVSSPTPYGSGTYFWGGLASTWFWIDPENDLYYIGMVQVFPVAAPVADFRRITADILYEALQN